MNLFVYGTLRSTALWSAVAGEVASSSDATLKGFAVVQVQDDVVPTIVAHPPALAQGRLMRDVSAEAKRRLDLYEGAWGYTLTEVEVMTEAGADTAWVYMPPEGQQVEDDPWSFEDWQDKHEIPSVLAAQEVFVRDIWPTPAQLRVILPMAQKRAWAQVRARDRTPPATVRAGHDRTQQPQVATIDAQKAPRGDFFAMQSIIVSHRRFDGGRNTALPREVFLGIEGALVLPYDRKADTLLLVEQVRMGPLMLGEGNPWVLEPIAGMVDAGETPEEAAAREAQEEAGLTDLTLEPMFAGYASPGSSTDYFYCYLGLSDLGAPRSYLGGLADEHEDLRLHILPFAQGWI